MIAENVARLIAERYGPVTVSGTVSAGGKFELNWIGIPGGRMRVFAAGYPDGESGWSVVDENDAGEQFISYKIGGGDPREVASNAIEYIEAHRVVHGAA